jgi:hypothetical protein
MNDNLRQWHIIARTHGMVIESTVRGMEQVTKLIRLYSKIGYSWSVKPV